MNRAINSASTPRRLQARPKTPVVAGRREDEGSEDVAPFGEASVRGEDHCTFIVSRIDDLEEQACATLNDGEVSGLVDDEGRGPSEEAGLLGGLPCRSALARLSVSSASVVL